jgi:TonB-linked SusC/RagA family outer membrane protein
MPKWEIFVCLLKKFLKGEKILRIMRVTALFLTIICIHLSVFAHGQDKITVVARNTVWSKALSAVEKASSYRFVYSSDIAPVNKKIDLVVRNADLPEVMDRLLLSTSLSYKVMPDKLIVLFSKTTDLPEIRVTGRITDENGFPLPGASVQVKGTSQGVSANANGEFVITVADDAVLVFTYVGYEERQISVSGQAVINVSLKPSVKVQDQVVVIGYGTATKRDLTGSIVKIAGKEVADRPNTNPVASLQGKVAGLSVVNSGTPGQQPDIRIRGTNSISSEGVRPLFVVDGIFNDNIDYLNPNDIESLEILKDPSSLAIFGVRGANGVIAITTKKAKAGQMIINLNSSFGSKKLVDKIKMVDAEGFKTLFTEEQQNIGVPANQMFDFSKWPGNTDWVDAVTQTGTFNTNNLSVTGSTEKNRFYMGIGYTGEEGIVRHEKLEKILLSISDELKVNKAIKIGFTFNGIRQKLPYSNANGILFDARRVLPITPVFNNDRNAYYDLAIQSAQITNPVMVLENNWDKQLRYENRLVGSVYAEINFLKYFNFKTTVYGDMSNLDSRTYRPIDSVYNPIINQVFIHPSFNRTTVSQSNSRWNKFQQDHILTFKKNFGDHGLTATAGFTTYYSEYRNLSATAKQSLTGLPIPDNKRFWYIDNGFVDPSTRESSSGQSEEATVSGLFRVLYNYQNKYFLNGSYRTDASSTISPFNRTKNFYSVGAAWEITRENFMSGQTFFDFLKVKASWGLLGGRNTAGLAYPFYPELLTGSTAVFGSIIVPAYGLAYEPARNLTWETVDGKEAGVEFDVLQKRLHGEIVYYNKLTKDLLAFENLGNNRRRLANLGNIRNKGFEFSATWNDKINKDLTYAVSANLTTLDNKVTKFPSGAKINASEERPNQTELGYPIGYFYGYVVEGVFQSYADKLASPVMNLGNSYGPGDLKYKDINGDGVIDPNDRTMIGNPTPDFMYGGSISLSYKGRLDFSMDFNGVYGNEIYRYWGSSELPFTKFNYPAFKLNRWHGEGTSNWDPILGDNHTTNRLPSTYGIEDGSYFRFRNIQIGYSFNPKRIERAHLKSLRVFANVQNLKTFKNNSGYTPEFGGSPTSFGIDNGNGAVPVIFTGGINVSF